MACERDPVLERALLTLPDKQRQIVYCRLVLEMSFAEIAVALAVDNVDSVRAQFHKATAQLRELRGMVASIAADHGMMLGAAGTHPFAHCEDQLITQRPRYLELADELGFIASR